MAIQFAGETFETETVACDFCGSTHFRPVSNRSRHGVAMSSVVCECGLCQTMPRMNAESLAHFYRDFYHRFHGRTGVNDAYVAKSRRMAEQRIAAIKAVVPTAARVLEIGSGAGQFLVVAQEKTDWHVCGIEPGQQSAAACVAQGLDVRDATVDTAEFAPDSFDVIVSFHVLEHLPSPGRFFEQAATWLKPGGMLWLEVPNLSRPGGQLESFFQLPHLYSFTAASLENYFRKHGFDARFLSEKPGQLTLTGIATGGTLPPVKSDVDALLAYYRNNERVPDWLNTFRDCPCCEKYGRRWNPSSRFEIQLVPRRRDTKAAVAKRCSRVRSSRTEAVRR